MQTKYLTLAIVYFCLSLSSNGQNIDKQIKQYIKDNQPEEALHLINNHPDTKSNTNHDNLVLFQKKFLNKKTNIENFNPLLLDSFIQILKKADITREINWHTTASNSFYAYQLIDLPRVSLMGCKVLEKEIKQKNLNTSKLLLSHLIWMTSELKFYNNSLSSKLLPSSQTYSSDYSKHRMEASHITNKYDLKTEQAIRHLFFKNISNLAILASENKDTTLTNNIFKYAILSGQPLPPINYLKILYQAESNDEIQFYHTQIASHLNYFSYDNIVKLCILTDRTVLFAIKKQYETSGLQTNDLILANINLYLKDIVKAKELFSQIEKSQHNFPIALIATSYLSFAQNQLAKRELPEVELIELFTLAKNYFIEANKTNPSQKNIEQIHPCDNCITIAQQS
ncbi:hypothetical protein [Carboxylicivirga marina]|uniref:Uncharacterized protein n=1 Tax=Carboxylicivirga marina TaxID=2800988 RepID=A0ABS1HM86_9BACT|nr:hypothetical protein [Carboxylicivirga marina]MBK3518784.1 hypothetical protein [Carboxylicivirga marina]